MPAIEGTIAANAPQRRPGPSPAHGSREPRSLGR
jgi:hypothetical protein